MKRDNTSWIEQELGDLIGNASLTTAVYTVDDRKALLHPPKNKGHEVMVYLTYIIDKYEDLADVNIFMHAHRKAYHNEELLDGDAAQMIRHLSPERVTREGYMNMRCNWEPGCPAWLFPVNAKLNAAKQEEVLLATAWPELFPLGRVPELLAQPCCGQFAVSRERILQIPKTRFVHLRDWLIRTDMSDFLSGRVFEYVWQFIFTGEAVHCPDMRACYCDGYGLCFSDDGKLKEWMESLARKKELQEKLVKLREEIDDENGENGVAFNNDRVLGNEADALRGKIEDLRKEMTRRRDEALVLGRDPKARALAAGREWKDGDGY